MFVGSSGNERNKVGVRDYKNQGVNKKKKKKSDSILAGIEFPGLKYTPKRFKLTW